MTAVKGSTIAAGSSQRLIGYWLAAASAAIVSLILGLCGWATYKINQQHLELALARTRNLVQVLEPYLAGTFDKADLAMRTVAFHYEARLRGGEHDEQAVMRLLAYELSELPEVEIIRIAAADGTVLPRADRARSINIADREYFQRARDGAGKALVFSEPMLGRVTNKRVIGLARRLNRPDGGFAGVVFAAVAVDQFRNTFAALDLGINGAISLRTDGLRLVARHPALPEPDGAIGSDSVSAQLAAAIRDGPDSGSYVAPTAIDGIERVNAYRRVAHYPFYVVAGISTEAWRSAARADLIGIVALGALASVLTLAFSALLLALWKRHLLAQGARIESEHRLSIASEAGSVGIWDLDLASGTAWRSARHARIFGYAPAEGTWSGAQFLQHVVAEERERVAQRLRDVRTAGNVELECPIDRTDGAVRWIAARGEVLRDEHGKPARLLGTVIDITDRKHAEDSLLEMNRNLEKRVAERTAKLQAALAELDAFSYSVSHDLRAPVRAIASFAQLALDEEAGRLSEEGVRMLNRIESSALRMGNLVDQLLALARLSRVELVHRQIDMRALAESVAAELAAQYPGTSVEIGALPVATGDETLLRQVLVNLLDNALKYSARRAAPKVEVLWDPSLGAYVVRDNGVGFEMEYAGKLFGTFERLHNEAEFPGTGIGLAIVKRLVGRLGGRVWAHSVPGEGTSFFFTVQAVAPARGMREDA